MSIRSNVEHVGVSLALGAAAGVVGGYVLHHETIPEDTVNTIALNNCAKILDNLVLNPNNGAALGQSVKDGCPKKDVDSLKKNSISVFEVGGQLVYGQPRVLISGNQLLKNKQSEAEAEDRHNRDEWLITSWGVGSILGLATGAAYLRGRRPKKLTDQETGKSSRHAAAESVR
jgi:hypothetical protein